jgi:hypothetical protein
VPKLENHLHRGTTLTSGSVVTSVGEVAVHLANHSFGNMWGSEKGRTDIEKAVEAKVEVDGGGRLGCAYSKARRSSVTSIVSQCFPGCVLL